MLKKVSDLGNRFMGKFSTSPRYVQAIQFDGSPACEENMHHITGGKVTVDNTNVDKPFMHIEIENMALALELGSWLVCKVSDDKIKWTSYDDKKFNELFQSVHVNWRQYPENKPEKREITKVFGLVAKGTEFEKQEQFYACWNGEKFVDVSGEDLIEIDGSVSHFFLASSIENPE